MYTTLYTIHNYTTNIEKDGPRRAAKSPVVLQMHTMSSVNL